MNNTEVIMTYVGASRTNMDCVPKTKRITTIFKSRDVLTPIGGAIMGVTPEEAAKLTYLQKELVDQQHVSLGMKIQEVYDPHTRRAKVFMETYRDSRLEKKVERELKGRIEADGWEITKWKYVGPSFGSRYPGDYIVHVKKA